jgi:prepilin-type N-terminal cleavage/methylation domain-containing protein
MRAPRRIMFSIGVQQARGFTLLEVMIALAIMALIFVILFTTYSAAVDRAARARELSQMYHEARVVLDLMANDLRAAYVKDEVAQAQQTLQQRRAPSYFFVGEDHTENGAPLDKLGFSTFIPQSRPDTPGTDVCRVTYTLEPVTEPPRGSVTESPQRKALLRRVNCSLDPEATDQDQLFLLTELARGLDFKYYDDKGTEYQEWNSQQPQGGKRLPAHVKITLLLADPQGQLHPFAMSSELVLAR